MKKPENLISDDRIVINQLTLKHLGLTAEDLAPGNNLEELTTGQLADLKFALQLAKDYQVNELASFLATAALNYLSDYNQRLIFIAAARRNLHKFGTDAAKGIYPAGADQNAELAEYLPDFYRLEGARILEVMLNPKGFSLQLQLMLLGYVPLDPEPSTGRTR